MAILERILYPSNKFAFSVYMVVLTMLAIFAASGLTKTIDVVCAAVGFVLGWTAHVIHYNTHKTVKLSERTLPNTVEFRAYQKNLDRAQDQLDQTPIV